MNGYGHTVMIHIPDRIVSDFITLLQMMHNSKLMNYFWNFPFNIFRHHRPQVTENTESKTTENRD